jgi:DNA-binding response OmpR family regulator
LSKLLLVEDDENLGASLEGYLKGEGYDVELVSTLASARTKTISSYSTVILDWNLPDGQGVDFLKEVREMKVNTPIIMLTARTELIDKVIGLESGANDYLTKPFEPRELVARIRVQARDAGTNNSQDEVENNLKITLGDIVIDKERREVSFENKVIDFTKMEFDFLCLLAETPNRAFSREEILNKVWGYENYPSTRTVDTHVLQLRTKLYDSLIETVRGIGYRLRF